jgi:hypothetical protein
MAGYDYGPLRAYELTWRSGHIETVEGHQVIFDSHKIEARDFLASAFGGVATETRTDPRFYVHGSFDGHWRLVLSAPESELHTLRDVTGREATAALGEPGA